jgi:isopentenyl-diphosphate delta-isomerase
MEKRMIAPPAIETRKLDHIDINLHRNVEYKGLSTGFERLQFRHSALPELSLEQIETSTTFLGKPLRAPLLISSMTGGVERGWQLLRRLACAAQQTGCALGVGSQRAALESSQRTGFFRVRAEAPDVLLFANLGAVQLNYGFGVDDCRRAVDMIEADGLFLHLNPLQEALQEGGNTDWSSLATGIEALCRQMEVPVIAKEVGFGISAPVARLLANCGVSAIDVSGAGGTSWSFVEHLRSSTHRQHQVSESFVDGGIPTARSLVEVRREVPEIPLIASGGMRTGIDAAKALALGASLAGVAGPMLRAADRSEAAAVEALHIIIDELRISMFAAGAARPSELRADQLFELDSPLLPEQEATL